MKKYFLLIVSAMMACSAMFYVSSCSEDTPMSEGLTKEATKAKAEAFAKKYNIGLSLNDEAFATGESNEAILEQFKKDVITLSAYKRDTTVVMSYSQRQVSTRNKLRVRRLLSVQESIEGYSQRTKFEIYLHPGNGSSYKRVSVYLSLKWGTDWRRTGTVEGEYSIENDYLLQNTQGSVSFSQTQFTQDAKGKVVSITALGKFRVSLGSYDYYYTVHVCIDGNSASVSVQ